MPWHVHNADRLPGRQRQPGEAEVDRHLAPLFLGQTIRVDAGQSLDQRRFAVIDVACRPNHIHRELVSLFRFWFLIRVHHQQNARPYRNHSLDAGHNIAYTARRSEQQRLVAQWVIEPLGNNPVDALGHRQQ